MDGKSIVDWKWHLTQVMTFRKSLLCQIFHLSQLKVKYALNVKWHSFQVFRLPTLLVGGYVYIEGNGWNWVKKNWIEWYLVPFIGLFKIWWNVFGSVSSSINFVPAKKYPIIIMVTFFCSIPFHFTHRFSLCQFVEKVVCLFVYAVFIFQRL